MVTLEQQRGLWEAELSHIFLKQEVLLQRWPHLNLFVVTSLDIKLPYSGNDYQLFDAPGKTPN